MTNHEWRVIALKCAHKRHIYFRRAIIIRFIFDNWPFERVIITSVPVPKSKIARAKISVSLVNTKLCFPCFSNRDVWYKTSQRSHFVNSL